MKESETHLVVFDEGWGEFREKDLKDADLRAALCDAVEHHHRNSCYPNMMDHERTIFVNRIIEIFQEWADRKGSEP